ncbi:MAG TPA: hypothetical protein EYG66_07970 [Mariprofundaceae bacterium]|nr:hypothetical protein [Mariprofundaceae bacterium]
MLRNFFYVMLVVFLSACAAKSGNDLRVSLGLVSAYDAAQTEFHQGLVMEARQRLLTIPKEDEDYAKAQVLLKDKVDPARLKLLRYYARKGKAEEKKKNWAKAEEAYRMAAELSRQPKALLTYEKNMSLKVRQLRFDTLYAQQKQEDTAWLKWQNAYTPPKGLFGDDEAFRLANEGVNQELKLHAEKTWSMAGVYEKKDMPELAWLYADAYLRLVSGDKKAQDLKNAMATALPKGFKLPKSKPVKEKAKTVKVVKQAVSASDVRLLIEQGAWLEAKLKAQKLRKQGHDEADGLLEDIDVNISSLAEKAYQDGNLAFRTEKIDAAVRFWQRAVDLKPNEQTYVDSLRRGKQIQERLGALKTEDKK